MNFFKIKVPIAYSFAFLIAGTAIPLLLLRNTERQTPHSQHDTETPAAVTNNCNYSISRIQGFTYIRPLALEQPDCESNKMQDVKKEITAALEQQQQKGVITEASVFLQDLITEEWVEVNSGLSFHPGSLMKVPLMIALIKMTDTQPGLLNKKLSGSKVTMIEMKQEFKSKHIDLASQYTIKELLRYMISYSDNYATEILSMQVSQVVLKQVFTDIGLQAPQLDANYVNYTISAANFSKFISVIYNAGYLSSAQSSFAAELLATSDFKSGLIQGLPEGTRIIHKFGEAGQEGAHELHESGIIYLNSRAYLLTVMTRGKDIKQLPATLSAISGIAYKYFKKDDV